VPCLHEDRCEPGFDETGKQRLGERPSLEADESQRKPEVLEELNRAETWSQDGSGGPVAPRRHNNRLDQPAPCKCSAIYRRAGCPGRNLRRPSRHIAIENTRLFEAEQDSKRELQESLEYQTAMSNVIGIISRSPNDLQPVLDAIVEIATSLCQADRAAVWRLVSGQFQFAAAFANSPEFIEHMKNNPPPVGREGILGRTVIEKRTLRVDDRQNDPGHQWNEIARKFNTRSMLTVPLMRENEPLGVVALVRDEVRPFTARQIGVIEAFAAQAVIAIENTRLFEEVQSRTREVTEALEQQTATADVLKVISRSALDLQRVLEALVESAARLCNAYDALIFQVFGDCLRLVAHHGQIPRPGPVGECTIPLERGRFAARAVFDRRTIHIADMLAEGDEYPESRKIALQTGQRTALAVPLVHAGAAIGVILIRRTEVRPFTERQIELVNTFADQAVIAIENTRLFEAEQARTKELSDRTQELAQALEHQTATNDVLSVISRSPNLLQPVLDAIVRTAQRLCKSDRAQFFRLEDGRYHLAADQGTNAAFLRFLADHPITPEPRSGSVTGRAAWERRTIHVPDTSANRDLALGDLDRPGRGRSVLAVPLLRDHLAIGVITLARDLLEPFTDKQIELIETFASQALIAIENARLFNEIAQKSRELEIASQHKSQFVANMSHELRTPLAAMLGYAELLQEGIYGAPPEKLLPILTRIRSNGKHLLGLINTVLDISKIEAGQFKLNLGEYALASIVETVMGATESLAATKKLAFKAEVAKALPYGFGDEQRLTQVLLNLVGNAIKFTDAGEVRISAGAANGHFTVSVSDTGPGIPAEECERIFEKFRQVDSSNTRAKGGTGLGLAIAREIVEMHGGRIWVESTLSQGSTFRIELPERAADAPSAA
jgi:signal transduction histidine kinase